MIVAESREEETWEQPVPFCVTFSPLSLHCLPHCVDLCNLKNPPVLHIIRKLLIARNICKQDLLFVPHSLVYLVLV